MTESNTPYFIYLLECADKSIYTGITTDIARRLAEHKNNIGARYTRAHGAKKILYTEKFSTRGDALRREAEIKHWPKIKKLALSNASSNRRKS
jgi:putative endonuclease